MGKLTDLQLRKWATAGKPLAGKSDGDGLTFTISANGTAAWVLRYRHGGKQREVTLGRYPDVSLATARLEASEARGRVQRGIDVAAQKREEKAEAKRAKSFEQLAREYLSVADIGPKTLRQRTLQLEADVFPKLGHRSTRSITRQDVGEIVTKVGKRSPAVARLVFIAIKEVFAYGINAGAVEVNVCSALKAGALAPDAKPRRERIALTDAEIHAVLKALHTIGADNEIAVRILLATCTRINELIHAKWAEVDLDAGEWTVPVGNSKTKKSIRVPLTAPVVKLFRQLKDRAGDSQYVMPTRARRRSADQSSNSSTLNAALSKLCARLVKEKASRRFTPHDLRSTARSQLSALGIDPIVAELCLNHSLGGLVSKMADIYNKHQYFDERRDALERLSERLAQIEAGAPAKVVSLHTGARASGVERAA